MNKLIRRVNTHYMMPYILLQILHAAKPINKNTFSDQMSKLSVSK